MWMGVAVSVTKQDVQFAFAELRREGRICKAMIKENSIYARLDGKFLFTPVTLSIFFETSPIYFLSLKFLSNFTLSSSLSLLLYSIGLSSKIFKISSKHTQLSTASIVISSSVATHCLQNHTLLQSPFFTTTSDQLSCQKKKKKKQ